jgi:hypothetical protein
MLGYDCIYDTDEEEKKEHVGTWTMEAGRIMKWEGGIAQTTSGGHRDWVSARVGRNRKKR